jgi:hypothetical protein
VKRPRLVLSLACLLVAGCEADKPAGPVTPEASATLPPASATAPIALPSATASATAEAAATPSADASSSAAAPSASAAATAAAPVPGLPAAKAGVLAAGAADRVLKTGGKPVVKLIEAGAEPRAAVAYAFTEGAIQSAVIGLDMVMGAKSKGMELPRTAVPHMAMTLDLNPAEKNAAGDFRIAAKLVDVGIEPTGITQTKIAESLKPQLATVKGMSMSYWVSPHGTVRDVKVDLPPGMPPEAAKMLQSMNQSFESMVAPLPKEPIGTGARWQVITRIASQGADILQYTTFTLKNREGTRLGLAADLKQFAANPVIDNPAIPAGMTARIKAFDSGGSGDTNLDTAEVAPVGGKLSMKSSMEIEVSQPSGPGESNVVHSDLTVTFARPKK